MVQPFLMRQIAIRVSLSLVYEVEPFLKHYSEKTGSTLLGRRDHSETDEALFIIQTKREVVSMKVFFICYLALRQQMIISLQFLHGSLLELSSPSIVEQMRDFPLADGDMWIPAYDDPQCVYLLTQTIVIKPTQAAWLLCRQEIVWRYL